MFRILLTMALVAAISTPALAQRYYQGPSVQHHQHNYYGGGGGVAPFVGGAIIGGIIGGMLVSPPVVVVPRPVCYEQWTGYYDQYGRRIIQTVCN